MENNARKPNIVLITADQWRGDCLGCAGGRHPVMTPHINQLAAEGVRFTQAYADCPVCMPQRVTLLTGQVASRFGMPHNFSVRSPVDSRTSLPASLAREAGYQTKAIGKTHFSPGRARLATKPARTGSPTPTMTMGIVGVASLAARVGGVPNVAIRSTGRRTVRSEALARP